MRALEPKSANVEDILRGPLVRSKVNFSRKVSGSSDVFEELKMKQSPQDVHQENMSMSKPNVYQFIGEDNSISVRSVQKMNMNIPVKFLGSKRKPEWTMLSMNTRKKKLRTT